jgi:hypothetical protein
MKAERVGLLIVAIPWLAIWFVGGLVAGPFIGMATAWSDIQREWREP